jgi:serine/threonine-protein kinase
MTAAASPRALALDSIGDSLPRQCGPYTLFEPLGRGGMAELFLARAETELGATRLAAVKLILPSFADDPKLAEMLVHEAKLAAGLSHRHIVNVLDLGSDRGRLYIAMEYVEGLDLNALLRLCAERGEGLPAEHALGMIVDVLEGLDYAHRFKTEDGTPLGIVHRDVSPSNVLISYEGEVKLCDFGIAHANDLVVGASDALKGKAGYMSPEHARGELLDARADVFAAGIILWELLAGRRLYRARADMPLLEQAQRAEIPPLPDKRLPKQAELERIVYRALALDRDDRYPTAAAFQRDLEDYLAIVGLLASRLKLGGWMATTFGTGLVEKRRESERALPKSSAPPPRASATSRPPLSSGPVRVRTSPASPASMVIPPAPRVPADLLSLSIPPPAQSLEGAAMDIAGASSTKLVDTGRVSVPEAEVIVPRARRGWVYVLVLLLIALAFAIVWVVAR